jgi:hypothetical protein
VTARLAGRPITAGRKLHRKRDLSRWGVPGRNWYGARMTQLAPAPNSVRRAFHEELDPGQKAALLSWLAFTGTFGGLRALTYSIRAGKGPFRNISVGGEHLHHYMWGIALLSGVGAVAVRGEERQRRHPGVAISYGAGNALIVDEFALLLDLRDVYWAKQGRISIDLGVGAIALSGSYFAALPILRRLRPDRQHKAAGHGPASNAETAPAATAD